MKKIVVIWLLVAMLSPAAHAIIPGLPGLEDPIKIEVEAKHISDRDWVRAGASPEISTVSVFFLKPTLEVMKGLDIFPMIGITDIDILAANGLPESSWGFGARYIMSPGFLPGIGEALEVGINFEYTRLTSVVFPVIDRHNSGHIEIAGWDLAVSVGQDMGKFAPYVGLRYSDKTLSWKEVGKPVIKHDAADKIGIFLGANIPRGDLVDINIELGFLDGTSLKIGTNFVF